MLVAVPAGTLCTVAGDQFSMSLHRNKSESGGNPASERDATQRMPQLGEVVLQDEGVDEDFDPERTLVQEDRTVVQEDWESETAVLEPIQLG